MSGRAPALKGAIMTTSITARLAAPTRTGLRSRNGVLMPALASRRARMAPRGGSAEFARSARSSEVAPRPGLADVVLDREAGARGQDDVALELAAVEVEEGAVDRRTSDLVELDRQDLHRTVELVSTSIEVPGHLSQAVDVLDEGRPDPGDEVGGLFGQVGDRVQRAEDGVLVLHQAGHEPLELDDQAAQLLVAVGQGAEDG